MRLLAFAKRDFSLDEYEIFSFEGEMKDELEKDLELLGIVGIRDPLQKGVPETIKKLKDDYGIYVSICTGDRKTTALAIAKEAGILENHVYDFLGDEKEQNLNDLNLYPTTLLLDGNILEKVSAKEKGDPILIKLKSQLKSAQNIVGYAMKPEMKSILCSMLRDLADEPLVFYMLRDVRKDPILAIGDGFNDIGMFRCANVSVAIRGSEYVESYADFTVSEFRDLKKLFEKSVGYYEKNADLINFMFMRSSAVVSAIVLFCIIHFKEPTRSVFSGFVLQAFNFLWAFAGVAYHCLFFVDEKRRDEDIKEENIDMARNLSLTNKRETTKWSILGFLEALCAVSLAFNINAESQSHFIAFVLISLLNIAFQSRMSLTKWSILANLVGPSLYVIYFLLI